MLTPFPALTDSLLQVRILLPDPLPGTCSNNAFASTQSSRKGLRTYGSRSEGDASVGFSWTPTPQVLQAPTQHISRSPFSVWWVIDNISLSADFSVCRSGRASPSGLRTSPKLGVWVCHYNAASMPPRFPGYPSRLTRCLVLKGRSLVRASTPPHFITTSSRTSPT